MIGGDSRTELGLRRDGRVRMDWRWSEGKGGVWNVWVRIELASGESEEELEYGGRYLDYRIL